MKSIKKYLAENNPERAAIFEEKAPAFIKKILGNFDVHSGFSISMVMILMILF